jgi:hypothetical protein
MLAALVMDRSSRRQSRATPSTEATPPIGSPSGIRATDRLAQKPPSARARSG